MGQVINISEAGIPMLLYGDKSNMISNYLYNQMQALPNVFNEFSERVYNTMLNSYNYVNDKLTQYGIINELQSNGINIIDNYYQELLTFEQLQQANLTMQRWIMAHPQVREMYVKQNMDGYSETYKNVFGKEVGEADYNHRLVMDGVITSIDDDYWVVKHYIGDLLPGDRELTHMEKATILTTWEAVNHMLNTSDYDFTCKSGQPVKFNKE